MIRLDNGEALRQAMRERGMSIPKLARASRDIDPEGTGVSVGAIGSLTSTGRAARDRTSVRTASLIARALGVPVSDLFSEPHIEVTGMPTDYTKRVTDLPSPLSSAPPTATVDEVAANYVTAKQIAATYKVSPQTVYGWVRNDPSGFPAVRLGRTLRFDPAAVHAYWQTTAAAA